MYLVIVVHFCRRSAKKTWMSLAIFDAIETLIMWLQTCFKRFQFFRNRIIFLFRVRTCTCFTVPGDYSIIPFAFQVLIFLCHTLNWMMCFHIKCKWPNYQNVLTLTALDAVDTTVPSLSLDLLAIGEPFHGRCWKPLLAALLPQRSDRVKGC